MTRESQTYSCQNRGCAGEGSFESAPEAWFRERGLTPPRNCPGCRAWIKAQVDELVECSACSWQIPISAKRKISFHRRDGPWQKPSLCAKCLLDPDRAKRVADAKRRVRRIERSKEFDQERAAELIEIVTRYDKYPGNPQHITVSPEPAYWHETTRDYAQDGIESLWKHIVEDHGNDIRTRAALTSVEQVPQYISELAASTDGSRVVQFTQRNGRLAKLDLLTSVALILDPVAGTPVTCFPYDKTKSIETKLREGIWT